MQATLHDVAPGVFAYTQLPGGWGFSNSGLITSDGESLLVDTLFDRRLTEDMLAAYTRAAPGAARIDVVVNTHGNGDHCYGNVCVGDARIIASEGCVATLRDMPPRKLHALVTLARALRRTGPVGRAVGRLLRTGGLRLPAAFFEAAPLVEELFGRFDFSGLDLVLPQETFREQLSLTVGGKRVELVEVESAHTVGDTMVFVPEDGVVFTGDILFEGAHPIMWEGPAQNWIDAFDVILGRSCDTVVPGHGPITDKKGVARARHYLVTLRDEARKRYDAGLSPDEACADIALDTFADFSEGERLYPNVVALYREFAGTRDVPHAVHLFAGMARHHPRRGDGGRKGR